MNYREYNKNKFMNMVKPFVEQGYMSELYSSDILAIYKVNNVGYYVFPFLSLKKDEGPIIGTMFNQRAMERIIENNNKVFEYLSKIDSNYMKKWSFDLNSKAIQVMKSINDNIEKYPENHIDLEWEEKIKNIGKKIK